MREHLASFRGKELETKFMDIAKVESDCSSAKTSGKLKRFAKGKMQKPFEEASFALEKGEMSALVDTKSGIHIFLRIGWDQMFIAIFSKWLPLNMKTDSGLWKSGSDFWDWRDRRFLAAFLSKQNSRLIFRDGERTLTRKEGCQVLETNFRQTFRPASSQQLWKKTLSKSQTASHEYTSFTVVIKSYLAGIIGASHLPKSWSAYPAQLSREEAQFFVLSTKEKATAFIRCGRR